MHHRLRQGLRAIRVWFIRPDLQRAALYLSPSLLDLFRTMRPVEAQHSLNVLDTLLVMGETNPSLLIAALLHDVGKARYPFRLWERVLVVVARKLAPGRISTWGDGRPTGWKRPFVISKQHPAWSAQLVRQAGADPLAVELIARHQSKIDQAQPSDPGCESDRLLRSLQAADDEN